MSGIRSITRSPSVKGVATADSAPIFVRTADNKVVIIPAGSGTTAVELLDSSSARSVNTKVLAADAVYTSNAALADLTGFTWTLTAGGTYHVSLLVPLASMTTNGGISIAFNYSNSLTLTSITVRGYISTDTDNTGGISVSSVTTTTQTKFIDTKAAAYTYLRLEGTLVVNAGGTLSIQAAQNTSHIDTTTITKGAVATVVRVL